jgi:hypothetical protein
MLGAGGPGGVGNLPCTDPTLGGQCSATATTSGGGAGGGAGAGLYGGGGGSGGGGPFGGGGGAGGGGGGGSSLASGANAGSTSGANPGTINGGNGLVTITWSTRPQAVPTLSTTASESVPVGGQISDAGTLSGGDAPTGTITFRVYGPADTGCFTALATSTASVSGNGTYRSDPFSASAPGTYRWVASYAGDPGNAPAAGGCGDPAESVTVTAAPPPTTPTCAVTAIRRPGPSGSAEQDVTVSDPGGLASVSGIHIANGQVFTGGSAGTRIDAQPSTPLAGEPTSVVLTAVKATAGTITVWSFDATNAAGNTTHCA